MSSSNDSSATSAQITEQRVRFELRRAILAMSSFLVDTLAPNAAPLCPEARRELIAWMERLYAYRAIGKGFSSLIHSMWTVLEATNECIDAARLRLLRDTLERLYANPQLPYVRARELRSDLLKSGLPVKNRELRALIVETLRERDA